ncbi:MAG: alpha/beta hydrolase [Candidatus Baltobacteraceae bacterium]
MRVANDDARIDVRVDGETGDAIVLLAGLMLTREVWDAQAKMLSAKYRVIRPDLRGVGATNVPDGPYLMETFASDVAAVLDSLGIERAAIAGHSLGGYVAIAFARMYLERLSRLALVCSRIDADTPELSKIRYGLAERVESERSPMPAVEWYFPKMLASTCYEGASAPAQTLAGMMKAADYRGAAATLRGMALRDPGTDIAADVSAPVLVVAGGLDRSVPFENARATAAAFPNSRLEVLEESGHVPMLEEPGRLGTLLEAWMVR